MSMGNTQFARFLCLACVLLLCVGVFGASDAFAGGAGYQPARANTAFACNGPNPQPVGASLFINPNCQPGAGFFGTFSTLICGYENALNQVMSRMYCGLRDIAMTPVQLVLTLYLIVFAISFMFGIVDFTTSEVVMRVFKFALVWAFVSEAQFAIGIMYNFFVGGTQDGIQLAITSMTRQQFDPNTNTYVTVNAGLNNMDSLAENSILSWLGRLNPLLFGIIIVIMIVLFPLFLFVANLVIQYLLIIARAILGYLLAITMITFLLVLSPIFLCFALFETTAYFFEQWVTTLISFTVQLTILFTFMSLMNFVDLGTYLESVANMIYMYKVSIWGGFFRIPLGIPTLCRYGYPNAGGGVVPTDGKTPVDATIFDTMRPTCSNIPAGGNVPLTDEHLYSPFELMVQSEFIGNLVVNIITLLILGQMLETFLRIVPEISRSLGGKMFAGRLGGLTDAGIKVDGGNIHLTGARALALTRVGFLEGVAKSGGFGHKKMLWGLKGAYDTYRSETFKTRSRRRNAGIYGEILSEARNLGEAPDTIKRRNNPARDIFDNPIPTNYDDDYEMERKDKKKNARKKWNYYLSNSPDGKWDGKV